MLKHNLGRHQNYSHGSKLRETNLTFSVLRLKMIQTRRNFPYIKINRKSYII